MANHRTVEERRQIVEQVSRHLADKGLMRTYLMGTPGLGKTTVDHFFTGQFTETALIKINAKLGTSFGTQSAPSWCGGYSRDKAREYEGTYLTIRPEFSDYTKVKAYITRITWTKIEQGFVLKGQIKYRPREPAFALTFKEERPSEPKREHSGQVWIPKGSYIYLVTTYGEGRLRAAILADLSDNQMLGIQLTLQQMGGATAFKPAASPIAFLKVDQWENRDLGLLDRSHTRYDEFTDILGDAEKGVSWGSISSAD